MGHPSVKGMPIICHVGIAPFVVYVQINKVGLETSTRHYFLFYEKMHNIGN
jgi:hypothetical protein